MNGTVTVAALNTNEAALLTCSLYLYKCLTVVAIMRVLLD